MPRSHRMTVADIEDLNEDPGFDLGVQEYNPNITDERDLDNIINLVHSESPESSPPPFPTQFELEQVVLSGGIGLIKLGDVLELHAPDVEDQDLPRGDFFLVKRIKEEHGTGDISFTGYRLRRTIHMAPMFSRKTNEVFLLYRTVQNDKRSVYEQALQEIASPEVFRKRKCIFTHLRDAALTTVYHPAVPAALPDSDRFRWFFNYGALVCRYVYIDERCYHSKQSYKGEARVIYKRECHAFQKRGIRVERSPSDPLDSETEASRVQRTMQHGPPRVQTFCDFFSGIGGVSEGARLAGFKVHVALEKDRTHMESYENNFPETQCLHMDAQDFPAYASRESHGGDHCHFSCPCKYWSMCHTVEGKDDEANRNIIFSVGALLAKTKPKTISNEQTPGFLIIEAHSLWFRMFVHTILDAGYNVRWEIQDQACFGLPQHRPRLIFIGAKIGHPIPPFPPPEHGPDDSGLKRFRTVQDVLAPLKRPGYRMQNDKWHQPDQEKEKYGVPYDPSTQLSGTLTTGGSLHHSGKRVNTVRELLLLQGFRIDYFVCGSKTKAREGAGNAWSPIASEKYLLQCAATTEAFENGFIDSEEHVDNLYNTLENNGIVIPSYATGYRYLCQLKKSTPLRTPLRVFGKRKELAPVPRDQRRADTSERSPLTHRMRSLSIVPAKREETPPREDNPPARDSRQKRPQKDVEKEIRSAKRRGNFIDLD